MSIEVLTARTADFTMEYFRFGTGEKTMVILPGLSVQSVMASADAVAAQYADMAQDFTIYLFDRRKELPASYSISDMADDTAKVFKELGLRQVYLFGASQGGMIAMVMAMRYPELVKKLALGSSACEASADAAEVVGKWIALAKEGKAEELYLDFGRKLYPEAVYRNAEELLKKTAKTVTKEELERFVILAESLKGFDVKDQLKMILCPVLVIGSDDDDVLGSDALNQIDAGLSDRIPHMRYLYEEYGHACFDTAPDYRKHLSCFYLNNFEAGAWNLELVEMISAMEQKPVYVIDPLPWQVPAEGEGAFFRVEDFIYRRGYAKKYHEKFSRILMKTYCYYNLEVVDHDQLIRNPAPEVLQKIFRERSENNKEDLLIFVNGRKTMIRRSCDDLNMAVYDPDEKLQKLFSALAASEGLFFWTPGE